jgi:hypothetical protein
MSNVDDAEQQDKVFEKLELSEACMEVQEARDGGKTKA